MSYDKTNWVDGVTPINAQNLNKIENKLMDLDGKVIDYAVASGTNSYTASITGIDSLVTGLSVKIKFTNANTGGSTLNINSLGAKAILKGNRSALSSGNIKAGQVFHLVYDGVSFQLLGEGGEYGTAQANHVLQGYTVGTEDGLITGTIPSKGAEVFTPSTSARTIVSGQYLSGTQTISPIVGTAVHGDVLSGKTFNSASAGINQTGTMVNRGDITSTITTQGGSYTIPQGYHSGSGKITANFSNLLAGNIRKGVNIGGVVGNFAQSYSKFTRKMNGVITVDDCPFAPNLVVLSWTASNNVCMITHLTTGTLWLVEDMVLYKSAFGGGSAYSMKAHSTFTMSANGFTFTASNSLYNSLPNNEYAVMAFMANV